MHKIVVFCKLIRWPNLVFILLTQLLFQYFVILPQAANNNEGIVFSGTAFILIAFAYLLIAAAGYIINDYFDLDIDLINKPGKVFITNGISKVNAMRWYIGINVLALACAVAASWLLGNYAALWFVIVCIVALYFYSSTFKKSFFAGNFMVSAITSSAIPVLTCSQLVQLSGSPLMYNGGPSIMALTILYTFFAFIISLGRELVKDMEDVEGDSHDNARTIPIVIGISKSRFIAAGYVLLLIALLLYCLPFLLRHKIILAVYTIIAVIAPLAFICLKIITSKNKADHHKLSSQFKMVMLTGILSMVFFKFFIN